MNRITDRCKNINVPQTSFAGGKNKWYRLEFLWVGSVHESHFSQLVKTSCSENMVDVQFYECVNLKGQPAFTFYLLAALKSGLW